MEIKPGMIVSYEPSDSYEYGVVYRLDEDGRGGMAAFLDECCGWDTLMLRHVGIDGDCVVVRNHRDAKLREARISEYEHCDDWYEVSEEQRLAQVLKILAMKPKEIVVRLDVLDGGYSYLAMITERSKLREAIYDLLASDECEWMRRLWPHLASSWEEMK